MIYLIHGQNVVDSRRFLTRLKTSYQNTQNIKGKNLSEKDLEIKLRELSHLLFGGKAAFIIEGFAGDFGILPKKLPEGADLILWSDRKLQAPDSKVKSFLFNKPIKANIFKLADAILFKKEKESQIILAQLLLEKEAPEKIIATLSRGFCLVYFVKENTIDNVNLSTYIQQKCIDQANYWSKLSAKKGLVHLLSSDLALKSGGRPTQILSNLINHLATL